MYIIDYDHPVHIYFIGIGGISMSGLAHILHDKGFRVSGSDRSRSAMVDTLTDMGIDIGIGEDAGRITGASPAIDVVVYTAAIHPDNPEYAAAVAAGIPMLTRAELLGQIMKFYRLPVAIAGTHGKTTTTSMLSKILLEADLDPTLSIGGVLREIGGNIRVGHSDYFVTEACEYTNSFLDFFPYISVILNIEADHLDFFKDLDDIRHSFRRFALKTPAEGALVTDGDLPDFDEFTEGLPCRIVTYGVRDDAGNGGRQYDFTADGITYDDHACATFTLLRKEAPDEPLQVSLSVPGIHNVKNSLAAIAVSYLLGVTDSVIVSALKHFSGTERRFEIKGEVNGFTIVDDYAHHPTEIRAALTAASRYPHKKLTVIFQSHTYTRTKALFDDFADALTLADEVLLAPVYAARETDTLGVSMEALASLIEEKGTKATAFDSFEEIEQYCLENCTKGDLLITMGAGDVVNIGNNLLSL